MSNEWSQWSGNEWQEHVMLLLKRHYAPGKFQEIPDGDRGDAGLEGWADDGCAYQCYAAEGAYSAADLLKKQKKKIGQDIKKFCKNKDILVSILTTKICRWILVVPKFKSKDLLAFAEGKAVEVREAKLPYAADDFCVRIINSDEFAVERQALVGAGLARINLVEPPPSAEIDAWSAGNEKLVRVLDGKVARMKPAWPDERRAAFRAEMIKHHVAGQNALAALHDNYGELYERVVKLQEQQEQLLAAESMAAIGVAPQVLRDTLDRFEKLLAENIAGIDGHMARALAWGAVADWMLRCPLDFEAVA